MAWLFCARTSNRNSRRRKFQHQTHDHVLKEDERRRNAFARVCHYILENPRRAELVTQPGEWKFSGAVVPGYPTLHPLEDDFWPAFWKLYAQSKHPAAGKILRPPTSVAAEVTEAQI